MLVGVRFKSDPTGLHPNYPMTRFRYQILMHLRIRPVYEVGRPVPGPTTILPVLTQESRKTARSS